jgi:FKBP-type peptidyl-prolyl cis-trans isomerase FklB
MRNIICLLTLVIATPVFSQSKKDMLTEIDQLKKQVEELSVENEALKRPKTVDLTDTLSKASYGLGTLVATNLTAQAGDSLNLEAFNEGVRDVFGDHQKQMTDEEVMAIVDAFMVNATSRKRTQLIEENAVFLEANKAKEGVVTTASGLQYKVIKSGTGKMPAATDKVTVHYTGQLINGTVFDSSVSRNEPATFQVDGVIDGWTEALQLMHEGDKWMLYIPFPLAYGERGAGNQIPPFSTLIFELELIKVN